MLFVPVMDWLEDNGVIRQVLLVEQSVYVTLTWVFPRSNSAAGARSLWPAHSVIGLCGTLFFF